jgi:hypothetical protein
MRLPKEPAVQHRAASDNTSMYAGTRPPGPTVLMRLLSSNVGDAAPFAAAWLGGVGLGASLVGAGARATNGHAAACRENSRCGARRARRLHDASVGRLCAMRALPPTAIVRSCHP